MAKGRKPLEKGENKQQLSFYVKEKIVEKLGKDNLQKHAEQMANKMYECDGTCEACICKPTN